MLTLIGTPPNLVVAEAWESTGGEALSFFTFLPAGAICLVAGTLLLLPLSRVFFGKKADKKKDGRSKHKTLNDLVDEYGLHADLCRIDIDRDSQLIGKTLAGLDLRNIYGIDVLEVRRVDSSVRLIKKVKHSTPDPTAPLSEGISLYIRGSKEHINEFAQTYDIELKHDENDLRFYDIGIAEIVPMPHSPILGKTVAELGFRKRYGVNVIGIMRKSQVIANSLGYTKIQSGDVMLVQGSWDAIGGLSADTKDWVVLGQPLAAASQVTLDYKAPLAAVIMLAMVVALVFDFVPPVVSVMTAALLMVLTGCFRNIEDAYKTINWESIVLIGAMMPMSYALEKTGVSAMVSGSLVSGLSDFGPTAIMAGIYLTTSVMTLFISNTATAVLMAPIALSSAVSLGVSPLPFLFAVSFAASLCFASPFSTPPNALVMPAGQYSFNDYVKVGLPLQILLGILMILVLPLIFPF